MLNAQQELPVTDSMGGLTAKKDQSLSGWDIRFLVPFWPEPEPEPDIKNGRISGQPEPDIIRYIHSLFVPLCEVPVLTAKLLRLRRAVLTLFSVLEAVCCTTL